MFAYLVKRRVLESDSKAVDGVLHEARANHHAGRAGGRNRPHRDDRRIGAAREARRGATRRKPGSKHFTGEEQVNRWDR